MNKSDTRHFGGLWATCACRVILSAFVFWPGSSWAELTIRSTYPTFQQVGSDVAVTISGSGFTSDTRLALSLDASNERFILDSIPVGAKPVPYQTVVIRDDKAYVASWNGLTIVSIANFSNLQVLSETLTPSLPTGIVLIGNHAILAFDQPGGGERGLAIYDISDARQPIEVGRLDLNPTVGSEPGWGFYGFAVVDDVAFVIDTAVHGLLFIDVSDPSNPRLTGEMGLPRPGCEPGMRCLPESAFGSTEYARSVTVINGETTALGGTREVQKVAWLYGASQGVMLLDVTDVQDPVFLGSLDPATTGPGTTTFTNAIELRGQHAFLSGSDLTILDVSDPVSPAYVGHLPLEVRAAGLGLGENRVYLASQARVATVDITDLQNPVLLGWATGSDLLVDVAVNGQIAVLSGAASLTSINLREPDPPFDAGWGVVNHSGGTYFVIDGDTLYEPARSGQTFNVLDVTDPINPLVLAAADINMGTPSSITVEGDFAYVTSDSHSDLVIIDVSDKSAPQEVSRVGASAAVGVGTNATLVEGDRAYVAAHDSGLAVIDLSDDRTNPQLERIIPNTAITVWQSWLAKHGDFIYHGNENGRNYIYDLRDDSVHTWPEGDQVITGLVIQDGLALTAINGRGLVVYDLQNPLAPLEIAAVPVTGSLGGAIDLAVSGDMAYLGGWVDSTVYMIDISDPTTPWLVGSIDAPGYVINVEVAGGFAWTGHPNGEPDNARVPLPILIPDTLSENPARMTAFVESPTVEGHYTLTANEGGEVAQLPGAISYFSRNLRSGSEDDEVSNEGGLSKVIIVAGGGPFPGNNLWDATVLVASKAYAALTTQGYRRENIRFLSPESLDVDFDGRLNDVDGLASLQRLEESILEWVMDPLAPAHDLVLYISDHGGDQSFRLNSEQTLSVQQLDEWLDTLQQTLPGKVIVIYEACQSGTFVSHLTPPPGKERIVITSAADESAWFTQQGRLSFSYQFWSVIQRGGLVSQAFRSGANMMSAFQSPQVDTNNNGVAGESGSGGDSLKGLRIGRGFVAASDNPTIGSVSAPFETHSHSAEITASGLIDATGVNRVWAVIRPPGYVSGDPDQPVLNIPTVDLLDDDGDNTWTGTYEGFREEGRYDIAIFASNATGGLSAPTELNPNRTTVMRIGSDPNLRPEITLIGRAGLALLSGETYVDEGVVAIDLEDGDVSASLVTTFDPALDTSSPGEYTQTYTVTDSEGLAAAVSRTIVVAGSGAVLEGPPDFDRDGIADSEDFDDDNDGVPDSLDRFPLDARERDDSDGDGIGDIADLDDDGDGVVDLLDHFPLDATLTIRGAVQNISTRGVVGTGDNVMIAGLIIEGQEARTVVIRARGPSLADFGVADALGNPSLQLFDVAGQLIGQNADWPLHESVGNLPVPLTPTSALEAAITITLSPGAYTAIVRGESDATGVGIVEVFDVTQD